MESALKILIVLASAPLWYRPLRSILEEIARVANAPEVPWAPERTVGTRERKASGAFSAQPPQRTQAWGDDAGRISNPRWETGRRTVRSAASRPDGGGFPSTRKRSGLQANTTRFGAGNWRGGFGRR